MNTNIRNKQSRWYQRLVRLGKYAAVIYWSIGVLGETQSYMVSIAIAAIGCVLIAEGELNDTRSQVMDALSERVDIAHRRIDALRSRMDSMPNTEGEPTARTDARTHP